MARMYTGSYQGYDGLYHHPWLDPDTGERGEDLSAEAPADTPGMFGPPRSALPTGAHQNVGPDPWLSAAATRVGLPLSQPIAPGFTAPGATLAEATANAQMNGQPFGSLGGPARPAAGTLLPAGGMQAYSNWGKDPVTIRQEYVDHLSNAALFPGYLPGSGEYNQFRLDQPGLIQFENGVPFNARYGLGGTGDPTTGREVQTESRWTGRLGADWMHRPAVAMGGGGQPGGGGANSAFSWSGNLSGEYSPLATLFGRSDTETGISTAAASAPDAIYQLLYRAIREGVVTPNSMGWQFLQSTKGVTPNQIGGAALGASTPGAGAAGAGSGFGQGEYFNYQAGLLANQAAEIAYQRTYHEWLAKNGDQQTAIAAAQQAATQAYQEAQVKIQEQELQANTGIQAAQLMASLRGPANAFAAANALYGLNRTTGVPNAVAALAGEYSAPSFQAPQSLPQAATLQTLAQQLGAAGTGSGNDMTTQAQQFAAALPTPNKVVGRQFAGLSPDTQQLVLAGYESLGYSPQDTLNTIQQGLPQFSAPAFGAVS